MGQTTLTYPPTGASVSINWVPSLANITRRSFQQDVITTDSGKQVVFSRQVPRWILELTYRELSVQAAADFAAFYFNVVKESRELFDIEFDQPIVARPLQAGETIGGVPLQIGDTVKCSPSDPGFILQAGQFIKVTDSQKFLNMRFQKDSFRESDPLRKAGSLSLILIHELQPVP